MTRDPYRIETIRSIARLQEIAPALDALAGRANPAFYHESPFLVPWCAEAEKLGQKPFFLALWTETDSLVGFVPLCRRRDPKALFAYRLSTPRIGSSPPFDALLSPDVDYTPAAAAIAAHLAGSSWMDLRLPQTLADSQFALAIAPALARRGMALQHVDAAVYYKLEGHASSEAFMARFKSKKRVELNRQCARFLEVVEIVTLDAPGQLDRAFDWIRQVTLRSWKEKSYLHDTFLPLLRRQLTGMCATGRAQLRFALKDGEPIAYLVEFIDRQGQRSAYFNAHDPRENALSPGMSLLQFCVREAFDSGVPAYRFWGDRDYIRKLSSDTDAICTIEVMRTGPYARFCAAMVRLVSNARPQRLRPKRA